MEKVVKQLLWATPGSGGFPIPGSVEKAWMWHLGQGQCCWVMVGLFQPEQFHDSLIIVLEFILPGGINSGHLKELGAELILYRKTEMLTLLTLERTLMLLYPKYPGFPGALSLVM